MATEVGFVLVSDSKSELARAHTMGTIVYLLTVLIYHKNQPFFYVGKYTIHTMDGMTVSFHQLKLMFPGERISHTTVVVLVRC